MNSSRSGSRSSSSSSSSSSNSNSSPDDSTNNLTMEKLIECSICLQYYNHKRRPKVLNCGHTFCSSCLKGVLSGVPPTCCSICRSAIYYGCVSYIPYNYSLDALVPPTKEHLGITSNSKQVQNLRRRMKEELEAEVGKELKKNAEEIIKYGIKEKLEVKKANLNRLKVKLEIQYKKKMERNNKSLKNTQAMLKEEIRKLKALRNQDKSEVRRLMYDNKNLLSEKKSMMQRKERVSRYKNRSSL